MVDLCINMALSDFYSEHTNYQTRLQLHTRDAKSLLEANFAGLQTAAEDKFLAEFGGKVHVPVISFTARSSTLPYSQNRYFIRTIPDDVYQAQAQALAAICQEFNWSEAVILYEDTESGIQFLSHLNKAFQESDIEIAYMSAISVSSEDNRILKELKKLMAKQQRVFLEHMNPLLGLVTGYFFLMMSEGKNSNRSYDDMLHEILDQVFDIVVGDTTIWGPRADYVDFSLPYSEPGVVLVVKNKKPLDMWIFVKPLRWNLWLTIIIACIFMGIVLRILEHTVPNTNEESVRPHREYGGIDAIFDEIPYMKIFLKKYDS
ncbi:Hypothetical predicted protein [Olea europaea subsp. europaea]|uniref:Receptor ligand binding region domain-containing protein n=1 Tax=Olea europaea subsp. europaea TaxID=158383 RepID=A0A8S0PV43_OLEEU|nr:Hypothetical predicted protein [Olea europaea subsp. europaea]